MGKYEQFLVENMIAKVKTYFNSDNKNNNISNGMETRVCFQLPLLIFNGFASPVRHQFPINSVNNNNHFTCIIHLYKYITGEQS